MRIALQAKRKLGFVLGTCKKDSFKSELNEDWEHMEIAIIYQGTDSVSAYFTRLKELCAEYDAIVPIPNSKEYVEHLQQQRLMQFLSGLNEVYDQARRQTLMKIVEPTLNQAYALIIEDESQNSSSHPALPNREDHVAMQTSKGKFTVQNSRGQYKGKKPFVKCDYCNKSGNSKENCYKLVGYPTDFKNKKPYATNMTNGGLENDK
ncbi:uncharacterized protein LOC142178310 [Nicotiana tabacum]|uniref:Uncharacterized protein LOC142178310 n=1 Tax=Nicotiana tabacum TaxID=4097 RepID=A0AC58U2N2_TOBAC